MAFITEGQDEYSRLFYPTARGYTPIQPHPVQLGVFSVEGVQIGDLVFRTCEGTILYSGMNVTRPCNDPRNFGTLPRNYAPVVLQQGIDYTVNNARFPSPGIFYSATAAFDVCSVPKTEESDSEKLEFSTNATAGAYCGLPFGGSSYDCTSIGLKKLQRAALANGHQWYYQLMHVDCFETQNGELCLVTGCDKASYWATGVFSSATSPVMKRMVMPHVDAETGAVKTGSLRIENWTPRAAQVDFAHISGRPDTSERLENQDSCITLRGFHIGLHDSLYNMAWCPTSTCQTFWQALPWPIQPRLKPWPVDSEYVAPYHPCAAVSALIHRLDKNLRISVVHDNDVLSVLNPDEKILPSDAELARRLTDKFIVAVDSSGSGYLEEKQEVTLTRFDKLRHKMNRLRHPMISSHFLFVHRRTWDVSSKMFEGRQISLRNGSWSRKQEEVCKLDLEGKYYDFSEDEE